MVKKFSIPGYFYYVNQIRMIEEYRKMRPEFFYPDRIIDSSYDFPPGLIWNGGRPQPFHNFEQSYLLGVAQYYNQESEIKIRHTCTNLLLVPEMLYDWQCNLWLQINEHEGNAVIVATDILKEYVKERYPKYDIINSTTLNITDIDEINKLSETDLTVLNYTKNNDNEYLKQLQHPENIEILCAEPCSINCKNRKKHYEQTSRFQLWIDLDLDEYCPHVDEMPYNFYDVQKLPTAVDNDRVDQLAELGIQYFKLSGRQSPIHSWYEQIIYYLILPEYRDRVRQDWLNIEYNIIMLKDVKGVIR